MKNVIGQFWGKGTCAAVLSGLLAVQPCLPAPVPVVDDPAVSLEDLRKELLQSSAQRREQRETLRTWFATPQAQKALHAARLDSSQLQSSIASLSDADLARLSARAATAQADFAAGRLTDRDLLLILIGIAALILIIVAVR